MIDKMLQTREDYVDLIRRELLGPGSEISNPDDEHELISSSPDVRYSLGILFPRDTKMNAENNDTVRSDSSEDDPEEDDEEEEITDTVANKEEHGIMDVSQDEESSQDEEDNLDEEISLSAQNMPSSAGITFLAIGDTKRITCDVSFGTYHAALPKECMVPYKAEHPEQVQVPTSLRQYVKYDTETQCFRMIAGGLNRKIVGASKRSDTSSESEEHDVYDAMYRLCDQLMRGYVRDPHNAEITLDFSDSEYNDGSGNGIDGIPVKLTGLRRKWRGEIWSITVMMVNDSVKPLRGQRKSKSLRSMHPAIFQPEIRITTEKNDFQFCPFSGMEDMTILDEEEKSLELQYRHKRNWANGLGTAANWSVDESGYGFITTDFFPMREMPNMDFNIPADSGIDRQALSMKYLSDLDKTSRYEKLEKLKTIVRAYGRWIDHVCSDIDDLNDELKGVAIHNMGNCSTACARMKAGLETLAENNNAWDAFQLANRAMYMQRAHLKLQEKTANDERFPGDVELSALLVSVEDDGYEVVDQKISDYYAWRLFQIAFLIMSVNSIILDDGSDRKLVDLIWFPTGGGKTEAYLGLTAFTIFYRRLQHPDSCGGTTVMMRYTLRLLTAQQFTRASTLICACEFIRSDAVSRRPRYGRYPLGEERITIGLWIGGNHTPNRNDRAKSCWKKLNDARPSNLRYEKETYNKFQVLKCPWCGTKLVKEVRDNKLVGQWGYAMRNNAHFELHCPQESCFFNAEGSLPIQVVDEELYSNPPSLLFGTVDKFAMLPWKPEIGAFFGIGSKNRAPELIIQDELHLISGPLGTMVGLYETAIDELCCEKGVATKIIASTATIRRANEQCAALYDRDVAQFPPPGIDAEDSFFSREEVINHDERRFGRLYIGLMPSGKTKAMMEVRTIAALMQRIYLMDLPDDIKDKYWTLTGYFNSLKELGKCSTLVEDDVKDAIRRMATRLGNRFRSRQITTADELTSRVSTTQLNETLDKLEKLNYSRENMENRRYASNIVLATNMISVGIDVARLNVMMMVGQPKLTSEYIQASSRVGRQYPGIVFTLYDGVRSRDRSHYEQFRAYHEAYYKYVEPTGATPFSGPARDRALHAIVIGMLRILEESLSGEKNVGAFDTDKYASRIDAVTAHILGRNADISRRISPDADNENGLIEEEIKTASDKKIRYFKITEKYNFHHNEDLIEGGRWITAEMPELIDMGSVAYFTAKHLREFENVPIGIYNTAIGGTPIKSWVSEETMRRLRLHVEEFNKCLDDNYIKGVVARDQADDVAWRNAAFEPYKTGETTGEKGVLNVPGWFDTIAPSLAGRNMSILVERDIDVPEDWSDKDVKLYLGAIIDSDMVYVNGTLVGETGYLYPPRIYHIPKGVLKKGTNHIEIRMLVFRCEGGFMPGKDYKLHSPEGVDISLEGEWNYEVKKRNAVYS